MPSAVRQTDGSEKTQRWSRQLSPPDSVPTSSRYRPPYCFNHTEEDFYEHAAAVADAADIGLIVYNTFWTSTAVSMGLIERLGAIPNIVGLKWSMPDNGFMQFEPIVSECSERFSVIDNQLCFPTSHMLGAGGIEVHVCNYWPQWGVRFWRLLEAERWPSRQAVYGARRIAIESFPPSDP